MAEGWGRVMIGTRLEKAVSAAFFQTWERILQEGLGPGDASLSIRGHVAHIAANRLCQRFLTTECDSLLFLDSDAVVEPDIIEQFRRHEDGFEYDILQAFYCRRGWPPTPIWLRRNELGKMMEMFVTKPDYTGSVDVAGLHCTMVRRRVIERMLEANEGDPASFAWFWYPRTHEISEDGTFCQEAIRLGFRVGATTAIRAGHLAELATDWGTYNEWLKMTGRDRMLQRYERLGRLVGEFTGEDPLLVMAKSQEARHEVAEAWRRLDPQTPGEVRAFYGRADNWYLYDLAWWNVQPGYQRLVAPLEQMQRGRALVVGPGLGTEIELLLAGDNRVDAFELPGVLREFLAWRFRDEPRVRLLQPEEVGDGGYDVVVAVDVIEHVHPAEVQGMLDWLWNEVRPGGYLVTHVAGTVGEFPQHYDHGQRVAKWLGRFEPVGDTVWRKREG